MNIFHRRAALPANLERHDLPGVALEVNHALKLVLFYCDNPYVHDADFAALTAHLKQQGYHLELIQPAAAVPVPSKP